MSIIIPIIDQAILQDREEDYAGKKKSSFWASESETMAFEIYHRFIGTPPTNPIDEEKLMMLRMRKLTEEAVVSAIRKSGKIIEKYSNETRCYFEWGPNKVPVSGYPDTGVTINNGEVIVEIKTYYGGMQHSQVAHGTVKTSYLKQLCIYMYHFKVRRGVLLMINQGTGERFEYEIYQSDTNEYHFICVDNDVEINLLDVFKRWEKIWVENVQKKIEPEIEYQYKYDITKINWDELAKSKIQKARTNKAVVGDWQILYSDFKDLIVEKQGTTLGYTKQELAYINEKTAGYTTKKENQVKFDPSDLE